MSNLYLEGHEYVVFELVLKLILYHQFLVCLFKLIIYYVLKATNLIQI